jgi:hypothetical protein
LGENPAWNVKFTTPDLPSENIPTGTKTMNALEVFQLSIDAWNRHDADASMPYMLKGRPTIAPALTTL